jgi:hypothetical protein
MSKCGTEFGQSGKYEFSEPGHKGSKFFAKGGEPLDVSFSALIINAAQNVFFHKLCECLSSHCRGTEIRAVFFK